MKLGQLPHLTVHQILLDARHGASTGHCPDSGDSRSEACFDDRVTLESLQAQLKRHNELLADDGAGGFKCRACHAPADYRTLRIGIFVDESPIEMTTTRPLAICATCHGWDDLDVQLHMTAEEVLLRRFLKAR